MPPRLILLALALSLLVAGCGASARSGPGGVPPLAPRDDWARQRVEAVLRLYDFTDQGHDAIRGMRVHHVLGRPGWFGSAGYESWLAIGQARPASVVHEISHSFWGAFSVSGRPELSWKRESGGGSASAMQALRHDLESFLQQPPDGYDPLRARLRLIPDLVTGPYPGLYHLGEAEIVYFTGGDLDLVPPVLRKYYSPFLKPGRFSSWNEAIEWYLRLPPEQRRLADGYFGVGSMPLDGYRYPIDPAGRLAQEAAEVLAKEERQRLADFVREFDLYFKRLDGARAVADDFRFWPGYLRDMAELYRARPEAADAEGRRAGQVREGLDFLVAIEGLPQKERPAFARRRLLEARSLLPFVAALDHRTLARLVSDGDTRLERQAATLVAGALAPAHLRYLKSAAQIQETARERPEAAGLDFSRFLSELDEGGRKELNFILELFRGVDGPLARRLLIRMSPELAAVVLKEAPAFLRFLLEPEELIDVLGFGGPLDSNRLAELARLINEHVAGTRSVDEPFLNAVYRRIAFLGAESPRDALEVFSQSGLLLEPFLVNYPQAATAIMGADLALTARVVREANPVRLPPARAIYRLIQADPSLAARLTLRFEEEGALDVVEEALAFFAYDGPSLRLRPGLPISLERDAQFLAHLVQLRGEPWLQGTLAGAFRRFELQIASGEVDEGFVEAYRETLRASLATLHDQEMRQRLERLVVSAIS